MHVEIITIGNEVLSGRTLDTNFAFLARSLEEVSVPVGWHSTVGDSPERIADALRRALGRADAVLLTGGLGPTPDDITRKAVATTLGRPLQLDDTVLAGIRERARRSGRKLPASIEGQALLPRGATVWPNPLGTAPGLLIVEDEKPVILLPGVPQEMEALATAFVVPYLRERTGVAVESFTLRTAGVFESQLHERIGNLPQRWPGASLAYLPSIFGVDLRVTATGADAAQGAVSAPVAEQLARGARERAGVEVGVGITGIAGPDGGSEEKPVGTVFIAVSSPRGESVRRFRFMGTRRTVRERAAQTALDMVRRELSGLPLDATLEG